MIVASGLHKIDIRNGLGWSYYTTTGEIDRSGTAAANAAGVGLGLLTGTFMFSTGYNLIWNIVSNVHSDNVGIYFASKERIARINEYGEVTWVNQFPAGLPSKSFLFSDEDLVYMINYGYASMNNGQFSYGTPFFAAYDKENGAQVFLSTINITRNPIIDFKILEDCVLLVFRDRIIKYSLLDGAQILEKMININELGRLTGFVGNNRVYIDAENSSLANLTLSDISKSYILTSNNQVLIVDDELNIVGDIGTDQFYIANRRIDDFLFVTKDNKTFILDADNKKVAEIDMELKPVWIGDKLYSVRENSFFEIDVANLIEHLQSTVVFGK